MFCLRPLFAFRSRRKNPQTGRYPLVFSRSEGFIDKTIKIPCGKCPLCLKRRARELATRCVDEAALHKDNIFLTLTYNDEHLVPDGQAYREVQLFLKRLRKATGLKFRYLCATEKGPRGTHRIHHHLCLFGFSPLSLKWRYYVRSSGKNFSYSCPKLTAIWGNGFTLCSPFSAKTAYYTCSYCLKKAYAASRPDEEYDSAVEKIRSSRRPAIGLNYFVKNHLQIMYSFRNGTKRNLCRYYIRKCEELFPLLHFICFILPRRRAGLCGIAGYLRKMLDISDFLHYPEENSYHEFLLEKSMLIRKDL